MNYEAMPIIRLEVENMKHAIMSHIGAKGSELGDRLAQKIDSAIASYDWQGQVTKIVHEAINDHIANYFTFGEGFKLVNAAIDEGFKAALNQSKNTQSCDEASKK